MWNYLWYKVNNQNLSEVAHNQITLWHRKHFSCNVSWPHGAPGIHSKILKSINKNQIQQWWYVFLWIIWKTCRKRFMFYFYMLNLKQIFILANSKRQIDNKYRYINQHSHYIYFRTRRFFQRCIINILLCPKRHISIKYTT